MEQVSAHAENKCFFDHNLLHIKCAAPELGVMSGVNSKVIYIYIHRNLLPRVAGDLSSTTLGKNAEPVATPGQHSISENDGSLPRSYPPLLSVLPANERRPTPGRLRAVLTPNSCAFALR